jgi:bifunctional UDP-N-acetylglucosamine pyrophosphorylase/glucosamine-1-phosphate N-acetyltransferase
MAGGKGTRMMSEKPKALIEIKGKPMIQRLLEGVVMVCERPAIVVGYKGNEIEGALGDSYIYVRQAEQLGTGHALMCAKEQLETLDTKNTIVIPGDHPLLRGETLIDLLKAHDESKATITLLTVLVPDFLGNNNVFYNNGRIIRDGKDNVAAIVELKDADEEQQNVRELNVSYYCFDSDWLWKNIDKLSNQNKAGEYYLTDMIAMAISQNKIVKALNIEDMREGMGVNTKEQLALLEEQL